MTRSFKVSSVANKWSARIALASISAALFVASANVLIDVDEDVVVVVPVLASSRCQDGNINLIQNSVVAGESSVTPTSNDAFRASKFIRVWRFGFIRQADWPDALVERDILFRLQDADIVQNLSLGDFVFFVAFDRLQQVSFLVFFGCHL